jgi:hypothetical protein
MNSSTRSILYSIVIGAALAGCDVGSTTTNETADAAPAIDAAPPIGKLITADETWSGTKALTDDVTIAPGVTVTVAAGTQITGTTGKTLRVRGTLKVNGTTASRVSFTSTSGMHAGIVIESGGSATVAYFDASKVATVFYVHAGGTLALDHAAITDISKAVDVGGGTATVTRSAFKKMGGGGVNMTAGTLTITDSTMEQSSGDIVVAQTGNLNISYSDLKTSHCNLHFGGDVVIKVTHNNISAAAFGLMFYGGTNADFSFNNWLNNTTEAVDPPTGNALAGRTGNFANGFWTKAPGTLTGATFLPLATAMLTDAGVRPE